MAAFDTPQPSRFSISECSVCLEAYHPQDHIPRMLKTCGHTFCERCLVQLKEKASPAMVVKCPACRKETKVEDKDPFPKNYALLENIEQVQRPSDQQEAASTVKQCDRCSNQPAEVGCGECAACLCGKCWGKIHSVGTLRAHTKVDCSKVLQLTCPNHPSKTVDLVCIERTCALYGSPICLLCESTGLHRGHLTEPIEQVADDKRKELKEIIEKSQNNVNFALTVLAQVQDTDERLHGQAQEKTKKGMNDASACDEDGNLLSNRDRAIRLINDNFNAHVEKLAQNRNNLIQQVDALVKDKAMKLEEQRAELSTFLSRSYAHLQEATRILKKSSDHQFISTFRILSDSLVEISKTELFPQPVTTPLIDLSFTPLMQEIGVLKDDGCVAQVRQSANGWQDTLMLRIKSGETQFLPAGRVKLPIVGTSQSQSQTIDVRGNFAAASNNARIPFCLFVIGSRLYYVPTAQLCAKARKQLDASQRPYQMTVDDKKRSNMHSTRFSEIPHGILLSADESLAAVMCATSLYVFSSPKLSNGSFTKSILGTCTAPKGLTFVDFAWVPSPFPSASSLILLCSDGTVLEFDPSVRGNCSSRVVCRRPGALALCFCSTLKRDFFLGCADATVEKYSFQGELILQQCVQGGTTGTTKVIIIQVDW